VSSLPPQIDTTNKPFLDALQIAEQTRSCLYLTGKAGTGKSTFLRYFTANTQKQYVVLAPTGIAAINVGGQTIHSFFGFPFEPITPRTRLPIFAEARYGENGGESRPEHPKRTLIRKLETVIIDEISMVRADLFDAIDKSLRLNGGNPNLPFGGKQVIVIGDVFQLPPVLTPDQEAAYNNLYNSPFFFSAAVFKQVSFANIQLEKAYRQQAEERTFIGILDRIREGSATRDDLHILNARYQPDFEPTPNDPYITLCTTNATADAINETRLAALDGVAFSYTGKIEGNFSPLPTKEILALKEGAQVMFIKNDPERRWANGTIGTVEHADGKTIEVSLIGEGEKYRRVLVDPVEWGNVEYGWDGDKEEVTKKSLGKFTQYPLKLAWAVTIHKSQGLTFPHVALHLGTGTFAAGQLYVALSRCTSLAGLVLKTPVYQRHIIVDGRVVAFSRQSNDPAMISQHLLAGMTGKIAELEARVVELEARNRELEEIVAGSEGV